LVMLGRYFQRGDRFWFLHWLRLRISVSLGEGFAGSAAVCPIAWLSRSCQELGFVLVVVGFALVVVGFAVAFERCSGGIRSCCGVAFERCSGNRRRGENRTVVVLIKRWELKLS